MANFNRQDIPVRGLITGHQLSIPVFRYQGVGSGPSVYIQANLHGAEVQGNAVIWQLIEYLTQVEPLADITLVPQCNPYGENQKIGEYTFGRFDPTTGSNWNRNFFYLTDPKSKNALNVDEFVQAHLQQPWESVRKNFKLALAKTIAAKKESAPAWGAAHGNSLCLTLQELSVGADLVFDLHTASVATSYLYSPLYAQAQAALLGVPHTLLIPEAFDGAMDEANFTPWWDLKEAFARAGRQVPMDVFAFTLELSSQEQINFAQAQVELQRLIAYFKKVGVLPSHAPDVLALPPTNNVACLLEHYRGLHSPCGGLVEFMVAPGARVQAGELLAKIYSFAKLQSAGDLKQSAREVYAPEEAVVINCFPSASILEGQSLFLLMTKYFSLETK